MKRRFAFVKSTLGTTKLALIEEAEIGKTKEAYQKKHVIAVIEVSGKAAAELGKALKANNIIANLTD